MLVKHDLKRRKSLFHKESALGDADEAVPWPASVDATGPPRWMEPEGGWFIRFQLSLFSLTQLGAAAH